MLVQILRACVPISLALLFFRLAWLGLARRYRFTCLFAASQVCVSIWLIYQFPAANTISYTWAWIFTRWPLMALLVAAVAEIYRHSCPHGRNPRLMARLGLLLGTGIMATCVAVIAWQYLAVDWANPYLVVRLYQVTCLVYSSLFFASVFFLIVTRVFLAQEQRIRPNAATCWTYLTLYLAVESMMIFLMNVLNREENMEIGYLGTPLVTCVVVAWSLSLSKEGKSWVGAVNSKPFAGSDRPGLARVTPRFLLPTHR